jgi:hypothetical protein
MQLEVWEEISQNPAEHCAVSIQGVIRNDKFWDLIERPRDVKAMVSEIEYSRVRDSRAK